MLQFKTQCLVKKGKLYKVYTREITYFTGYMLDIRPTYVKYIA